ncbi:Nucleotide-binding protein, UspA family [Halapricum desulfuricans]|uniref:Nucleotide-binding protein, UspA family n=1 Tax=Halapricum desulfuricans TaxID=2841257 RepID=A0A897NPH3_9EURY|nr:universal stress protein [Halapricum desulfuricans]QSG13375.1 Nucleotide-binding protein, UspA family [Halapricum desulfuricans]
MTSRILVPMDDSEMAEHALEHALEMYPDAEITVLNIVGEPSGMMGKATSLALADDIEEAAEERASEIFDRAHEIAGDREISTDIAWGNPSKVIVNRAESFDAVVIGSHGGSLADRLFVGNVAQQVFRHSPAPVTVVR